MLQQNSSSSAFAEQWSQALLCGTLSRNWRREDSPIMREAMPLAPEEIK